MVHKCCRKWRLSNNSSWIPFHNEVPLHHHGVESHHQPMQEDFYLQELEDLVLVKESSIGMKIFVDDAVACCKKVDFAPVTRNGRS